MLKFLGIGLGRVDLVLERHTFVPGDPVRGRVRWALEEPTPARRVAVGIYATQRVVTSHVGGQGNTVGYRKDKVWSFEQALGGEDLYTTGEAAFEIVIPSNVLRGGACEPPPGPLGDVVRVVSFLSPNKRFPIEWEVRGFVDVPFKVNPKAKAAITVTEWVNR